MTTDGTAGWPRWAHVGGRPNGENRDRMTGIEVLEGAARLLAGGSTYVQHTWACRADGTGCVSENPEAARWSLHGALWRTWWDGEGAAVRRRETTVKGIVGAGWIWAHYQCGQAGLRLIHADDALTASIPAPTRIQPLVYDALCRAHGWPIVARILEMATIAERANTLPL